MPFVMEQVLVQKRGLQYQRNLPYLTKVQRGISDLPLDRNTDYQYLISYLESLDRVKSLNNSCLINFRKTQYDVSLIT